MHVLERGRNPNELLQTWIQIPMPIIGHPSSCNTQRHDWLFDGLTLKVLVTTIDAQWEGMGDVRSARYEPPLLPPYPTKRVLSYSN